MKKIWKFILKYRVIIVLALLLIFAGFVFFTFKSFLYPENDKTVYGNRLEGIEKVQISDETKNKVLSFIKEDEKITDATMRIQGKIVIISIKASTQENTIDVLKKKCEEVLKQFSLDEINYYDFQFFVKNEDANYVLIGYKNKKNEALSFSSDEIISEVEEDEGEEQ